MNSYGEGSPNNEQMDELVSKLKVTAEQNQVKYQLRVWSRQGEVLFICEVIKVIRLKKFR